MQQLYDAAVSGVAQGFKEARDILDHLELLQGGIKTQVDETEQKTFAALAEIAPGGRESRARAVLGGCRALSQLGGYVAAPADAGGG